MLKLLYRRNFGTLPTTPIDIPVSAQTDRLIVGVDTSVKKASWTSAGTICQRYLSPTGWVESTPINIKLGAPQSIDVVPMGNYQIRFRPQPWLRDVDISISQDVAVIEPHMHQIVDIDSLQTALDAKSPIGHSHVITDVTGLQTALDGKALSIHNHTIGDVTGLQSAITDLYSPLLSFPYSVSDYKYPVISAGSVVNQSMSGGNLVFVPYFNYVGFTASEIGFRTANNNASFRVGFYTMGADGSPSSLIWDSGLLTVVSTQSNLWTATAIPLTLARGWYWIANVASSTLQMSMCPLLHYPLGQPDTGTGNATAGYQVSGTASPSNPMPSQAPSKSALVPAAVTFFNARIPYFRYR